ncbi:MAG: putative basic amino acid antiporter YfcC [Peptoniphilaceae bacterium]|nr:putative basic amino acid antiporter YfcC [Peptoniphilaceae bacterium]
MKKRDLTKFKTPHTYAIIFFVVVLSWILTFLIPAGKFSTHEVEYENANGEISSRTVLQTETFRYMHPLDKKFLSENLSKLFEDKEALEEHEIDEDGFALLLKEPADSWTVESLAEVGLTDDTLYEIYGEDFYDTSVKLNKTATVWGTEDFNGFGFLNFLFEGLVSGDKYGSAVGIIALLLVVGGAFGIIMNTGAIDAGIYAVIDKTKGLEKFAIPILFYLFSLGGATFGMSEEVIPFSMVMVPFVIALGYDSIVAVTVTFVASQLGNAVSWMSPFSVAIAQGIAGIPVLSGAGFRLICWVVVTGLGAAYTMLYAQKIYKDPRKSLTYENDNKFRLKLQEDTSAKEFKLGHKIILLEMLAVLIWIVWGVMKKSYYIPEIASQFFVMGLVGGITAVIFKLNNMTINDMASSFQSGAADLAGTAVVVGMAKGILIVLGGSDANSFSALNTILYSVGNAFSGVPKTLAAIGMYLFQSLFNLVVTSNSGQAALTMPIMAPLADLVGLSRQIAVLAYQMGAGFMDAFTPVSASLIGVLGVAGIDWSKWAKFQIKMQTFFFIIGSVILIIAVAINFQ